MLLNAANVPAQDKPAVSAPDAGKPQPVAAGEKPARGFDELADKALLAMQQRAAELKVTGVAVVAYSEGDSVKSWSSKMVVVGNLKTGPSKNDPAGANLLAIAYAKAAEMADTLKASGSAGRPPLKGRVRLAGRSGGQGANGNFDRGFQRRPFRGRRENFPGRPRGPVRNAVIRRDQRIFRGWFSAIVPGL